MKRILSRSLVLSLCLLLSLPTVADAFLSRADQLSGTYVQVGHFYTPRNHCKSYERCFGEDTIMASNDEFHESQDDGSLH